MNTQEYLKNVSDIIPEVKRLASLYYKRLGRPLGVTGEIAEYEVIKKFGYNPAEPRATGHDSYRVINKKNQLIEIKGRVLQPDSSPGGRLGRIKKNSDCVAVILVLFNENYEATNFYEAPYLEIENFLSSATGKAETERRQLHLSKFISLAKEIS